MAKVGRPFPPRDLLTVEDEEDFSFVRDQSAETWIRATFIDPDGPLFNPDHEHLEDAEIGLLWTNYRARVCGIPIAGQMEMPALRGKGWIKSRQEFQIKEWFGHELPDFIMTLSAPAAARDDDASFCALVEHELYHAGQSLDGDGEPRINLQTGRPVFTIRGHDVEEFVGVVRRYGAGAAAGRTMELVKAAMEEPEVDVATIIQMCGTCTKAA